MKFLRGGCGCGKTFMANLVVHDAQKAGLATSFVVVSDNDLHFHKFDELYREVVSGLSTPACKQGALGDILDRWIGALEEGLIDPGTSEDEPAFDKKVPGKLDQQLEMTGGRRPRGHGARRPEDLRAQAGVAPAGRRGARLLAVRQLERRRRIKNMVKSAGYGGLVIVIDEAETILRMRGDVRGKSLNAIRQIVDMASGNPGLLWVFTGTFTFFDDRQGVKGVEARYARIRYEELNGVPSLRQPQLALEPFDRDRLSKVALKLRSMHPDLDPEEAERRLPRELIEQLLDKVTEGYHGDVGVVPRQFLRTLVNLLDLLADDENENAHDRLGFVPAVLTEEEEAVIAGRKLDGKNAVVLAPTAGGKTEASIFPILAGLLESPPVGVGAIYVAPITALLNNQEVRLGEYTEMVGLRRFVWHGDAAATKKQAFVSEPAELLMTTPESLEVMLMSARVPVQRLFGELRFVVIDEIHAFADTDRGAHLMSVLERQATLSKHDVQRATVGNPEQIATWLKGTSERESVVVDPPKVKAERRIEIGLYDDTDEFAREAVREGRGKKSLFFCQSRSLTETIADKMRDDEIEVFGHHGSVSKEERLAAEERFARGTNACIVATSTAWT